MPEPPDFERIAFAIVQRIWGNTELDQPGLIIETHAVATQLRQVWNARGAADCAKVELLDEAPADMTTAAIRSLDR